MAVDFGMDKLFEGDHISDFYLDGFFSLPKKCQEMFFWYLDTFCEPKYTRDSFGPFEVFGFPDNECKSPIEKIFLMAYQLLSFTCDLPCLDLEPQAEIKVNGKTYYADFLFDSDEMFSETYTSENDFKLIIECDGHEYHHKTKEQVKHDNERDLNLKTAGYDVLHFSGSQIYQRPFKCAEEAANYILQHLGKIEVGGRVEEWKKERNNGDL